MILTEYTEKQCPVNGEKGFTSYKTSVPLQQVLQLSLSHRPSKVHPHLFLSETEHRMVIWFDINENNREIRLNQYNN